VITVIIILIEKVTILRYYITQYGYVNLNNQLIKIAINYHGDMLTAIRLKMILNWKELIAGLLFLLAVTGAANAQLNGTYNVGSGQTYTSLTGNGAGGFFNAVNTQGLSGNVTVLITSNISESGTISLNQWAGAFTISIQPSAATLRTLSGNVGSPLINLNGADNLTIDGRFSGSGRYLRFINTNNAGQTFRYINDATNNTLTYCIVEGARFSNTSGVIDFSTTTGSTGNDNNTISNCQLRDISATGFTPQNIVVSNGTTTSTARNNSGNIVNNNEIFNFYSSGVTSTGVLLLNGTTTTTISGNSFYQTATRTPGASSNLIMIYVNTASANGIVVSGNYLGGTAVSCGGTALTLNGTSSSSVYPILFGASGTTTASSVDGNTIANISVTVTPSTAGTSYFGGISVVSGHVNIGTTTGNVIGNTTSNANILITLNGTTDNLITRGIDHRGRGDISNNTIGSIRIAGNNNQTVRLECINYAATPTAITNITGNTIGSTTTSNSLEQSSNTFEFQLTGIYSAINTVTLNISGNTIANLRVSSTAASSRLRGIYQNRATTANINISNNTLSGLYCASSSTDRYPDNTGLVGIFTGSNSTTQLVSGNTISGLFCTGNSNSYVQGFSFYSNVSKGTFQNNRIYNLNHSSTTGSAKIWGINAFWGSWNFLNNQIALTNGEPSDNNNSGNYVVTVTDNKEFPVNNIDGQEGNSETAFIREEAPSIGLRRDKESIKYSTDASTNGVEIKGIHDEAEFPCLYYYNSIYIGGTATSGSAISWAYDRPLLTWATAATLRNNLFFNARTGGTGKHYAFGNEVGDSNWTNTSSDFNVYIAPNINAIAVWETNDQTIQQWRVSCSGDKHTWSTTSGLLSAASLFTSIPNGNLNINTSNSAAWIVSGKGLAIAGFGTDIDGNTRPVSISEGCTDIGADEFTATPPSNPLATVDNAPGSGVTSTYSLWGRNLIAINWGTGGSSYPTSMSVNYYSGVNHSGVLGGGYSNSYWSVNPVGSLTGASYDITVFFGSNETYTISTPSANTRLAKYSGTWEVFSTLGTGTWQSELDWVNESVKTRTLLNFSDFALTDGTNPLPVELCSFNAAVFSRDVDLAWTTCSEVNNKGFDIERRAYNTVTNEYSSWVKAGFVAGKGTTNEQQNYRFSDRKLVSGKYQYRLKQIDFNGNFEYHDLTSPQDIIIGNPSVAELYQNYPNPSNPTSKVDYQIPFAGKVSLKVYDITGKEVASLVEKDMESGYYTAEFNGSGLASGVYFYRLTASSPQGNSFSKTMKLILIK
jgi:hypothetical protein